MVDDNGGGSGRRGKKKGRGRGRTTATEGGNGVNHGVGSAAGTGRADVEASFPVVSDSRFSSMHSAPVSFPASQAFVSSLTCGWCSAVHVCGINRTGIWTQNTVQLLTRY